MKILVTGASGQLGTAIEKLSSETKNIEWQFVNSDKLDFTSLDRIKEFLLEVNPDIIVNCAAYTAVDKAEAEVDLCFKINAHAVKVLADCCNEMGVKLIHISSDYVYHINKKTPLEESDPTHPRGVYARSKREGEIAIMESNCNYIIIRTSWVYGATGSNFVKTILRLSKEREALTIVNDQFGALTRAKDLANALIHIIAHYSHHQESWNQVYNFSNQGQTNWAEIAQTIVDYKNLKTIIKPIPSSEYPTAASRPLWSVLSSEKFKKSFDYTIPGWKVSLEECLKEL